ncbi:helix-turn-helix domain-containing protein [Prevotella veroralis]
MNRIEEVIKEHGYTITSLAEKIGTSKQNLFAKLKSPSYPTLIEIATALNVPMWQLFASPEEVAGSGDFVAFIKDGREIYHADSWQELEKLVSNKK